MGLEGCVAIRQACCSQRLIAMLCVLGLELVLIEVSKVLVALEPSRASEIYGLGE